MNTSKFAFFKYSDLLTDEEKRFYYIRIKRFVWKIALEYPSFWIWFDKIIDKRLELNQDREIIICDYIGDIAGIAILKDDGYEKKICMLRVSKIYQHNGIGSQLVEKSMEWLKNDKPLITVSNHRNKEFDALFRYYGYKLEEKKKHYYGLLNTECVYNGVLPDRKPAVDRLIQALVSDKIEGCTWFNIGRFSKNSKSIYI